jgi:putative hydrolase of the HAD superfamily
MIFFDIDDTLLDDRHAQDEAARGLWREFAHLLPYTEGEFPGVWEAISSHYYTRFTAGEISFTEQRRTRIREVFRQPDLAGPEADRRFAHYLAHHESKWQLFADTLPCLTALAGCRLGIISNGDPAQQRRKLRAMNIAALFSPIVVSGDIGKPKPQPEIFLHACALAGVAPAQCAYVGDKLDFDARGSRAAGMQGIWLNRWDAAPEDGIPTIATLAELPGLLQAESSM